VNTDLIFGVFSRTDARRRIHLVAPDLASETLSRRSHVGEPGVELLVVVTQEEMIVNEACFGPPQLRQSRGGDAERFFFDHYCALYV
jgi:hypothetical protein